MYLLHEYGDLMTALAVSQQTNSSPFFIDPSTFNVSLATLLFILNILIFVISTWAMAVYGKIRKVYSTILMWLLFGAGSASLVSSMVFYIYCLGKAVGITAWLGGLLSAGVLTFIYRRKHGIKDADQVYIEEQRALAKAPLPVRVRKARNHMILITILAVVGILSLPIWTAWGFWRSGFSVEKSLRYALRVFGQLDEKVWILIAICGFWSVLANDRRLRKQQRELWARSTITCSIMPARR